MKKLLSIALTIALLLCFFNFGNLFVSAQTPNPASDFIAFEGVIEEYIGKTSNVVIPSRIGGYTVTTIARSAFQGCEILTSVVIPEGVTSIGKDAFLYCVNLKTVTLPYSLTKMGSAAFSRTDIRSITIPPNLKKVPYGAFEFCKNLSDIKFSYGVEEIHAFAFRGTSDPSIIFPETVKVICGSSFNYLDILRPPVEFVICNPDCKFGPFISYGDYEDYMKGNYTGEIAIPLSTSRFFETKGIKIIVPQNSYVGKFIEDNKKTLLYNNQPTKEQMDEYELEYCQSYYFEQLPENKEGYGIQKPQIEPTTPNPSQNNTPNNDNQPSGSQASGGQSSSNQSSGNQSSSNTPQNNSATTNESQSSSNNSTSNNSTPSTPPPVTEVTENSEETQPEVEPEEEDTTINPQIEFKAVSLTPVAIMLYVMAGIVVVLIAVFVIIFRKDIFIKK